MERLMETGEYYIYKWGYKLPFAKVVTTEKEVINICVEGDLQWSRFPFDKYGQEGNGVTKK